MPLILVIEQEQRYVERIEEALGPQGWEVVGVEDRSAAMRLVADRAADLVVINTEVTEAAGLVATFARANGGPGAVVLVPESDGYSVPEEADEVLQKPFTDQDLRLAVRRCVAAARDLPEAAEKPEPASEDRFSSEDIFGDVVLELEGAFNLGAAGAEAAASAVSGETDGGPVEEETAAAVEEVQMEEEEPVETVDVPDEPAEEPSLVAAESVDAVEEIDIALEALELEVAETPEDEAFEEAPVEEEPAEEAPAEEEPAEEEPAEDEQAPTEATDEPEEPDEAEAAVEAAEKEPEAAPEEPKAKKRPDKKLLEERLHEALVQGKAMAVKESRPAAPMGSSQSADLLLQKALATLNADTKKAARIDDEFAAPAHATLEEVDDLVSTVVGKKIEVPEAPVPEVEADVADDWAEDDDAAPALDITESDLIASDEGEYRTRMKILWAVILVALATLLIFIVTKQSGDEPPTVPVAPVSASERPSAAVTEPEGPSELPDGEPVDAVEEGAGGSSDDGADGAGVDEVVDREQRLRQEFAAEKRQLQAEVSRTQGKKQASDYEEDGGGA